jgi:hypothetical protein
MMNTEVAPTDNRVASPSDITTSLPHTVDPFLSEEKDVPEMKYPYQVTEETIKIAREHGNETNADGVLIKNPTGLTFFDFDTKSVYICEGPEEDVIYYRLHNGRYETSGPIEAFYSDIGDLLVSFKLPTGIVKVDFENRSEYPPGAYEKFEEYEIAMSQKAEDYFIDYYNPGISNVSGPSAMDASDGPDMDASDGPNMNSYEVNHSMLSKYNNENGCFVTCPVGLYFFNSDTEQSELCEVELPNVGYFVLHINDAKGELYEFNPLSMTCLDIGDFLISFRYPEGTLSWDENVREGSVDHQKMIEGVEYGRVVGNGYFNLFRNAKIEVPPYVVTKVMMEKYGLHYRGTEYYSFESPVGLHFYDIDTKQSFECKSKIPGLNYYRLAVNGPPMDLNLSPISDYIVSVGDILVTFTFPEGIYSTDNIYLSGLESEIRAKLSVDGAIMETEPFVNPGENSIFTFEGIGSAISAAVPAPVSESKDEESKDEESKDEESKDGKM